MTYIRVKDKWVYLYRAVDSSGATIDFLLSAKRDAAAAERFHSQSLRAVRIIRRRGSSTPTSTPVIHPPLPGSKPQRPGKPDVLLIGTGSEVSLCLNAQEALKKQGVEARVISMPSWKLFEDQDEAYRESVLPSHIRARVSVEQAARFGWERYVGIDGARVGMRTFGESAPLQKLVKKFGFTVDAVVAAAIEQSNSAKG